MLEFAFTLKPDMKPERIVSLARQAEAAGFNYGWIFDSHILWQEPYPLLTLIAANTRKLRLGTCVTNPVVRDPTVTASLLATLNRISGGRMDCGIGRGDSSRRVMNNRVRRIDSKSGVISTFAGTGDAEATPDDAALEGTPARGPRSIDIAPNGTMYLILREGNKVFTIDPARGRLRRIAGTGELGYSGDGGPAISARFGAPGNPLNGPKGVTYAADNSLYISDTENHVIRRIDLRSRLISTVVGTGKRGNGQDGDPRACQLARPHA